LKGGKKHMNYMGVDVGSVSTDFVLIDNSMRLLKKYIYEQRESL
jgi:activator of 2-hydroxyglutaryl-CoA dehydratase